MGRERARDHHRSGNGKRKVNSREPINGRLDPAFMASIYLQVAFSNSRQGCGPGASRHTSPDVTLGRA